MAPRNGFKAAPVRSKSSDGGRGGPGAAKRATARSTGERRNASALPRGVAKLYHDAVRRSRTSGRSVSVRFVVDPSGAVIAPVTEPAASPRPHETSPVPAPPHTATGDAYPVGPAPEPDAGLQAALAAARARGERRAAEILTGADMLSAEQFADLIGTSRVTVNTRRQRRELLALDGAKRGFRFPAWQVDRDGKPFAALPALFDRLGGGAWAVYRFLVQPHPELDGRTGREALERGMAEQAVAAAESVGRDFR